MNKKCKELEYNDVADDSFVVIEGKTQKELNEEIVFVLEQQSQEILNLYIENLELKKQVRKLKRAAA